MKKVILPFVAAALLQTAHAQRFVIVNDETPIPAADIEKITYEVDDQFEASLLSARLAADPKTKLFSEALQLTGLADTLKTYWIDYYHEPTKYYYKKHTWNEVAWFNTERPRMFTVFAETDDVLAAQGINSLDNLKAYAKGVYDAVYPEDAGVSDPTDRRNSLNRFVAYHVLRHGSSYYYLTPYDGQEIVHNFDRNLADIAAWYATLMTGAAIKCSYPDAGSESGLYLNRRGLKDGSDKYGKLIRGAKIVADGSDGDDPFTHTAFNGYYYYIDRLLTYDKQTRDDVLGGERWRTDVKTLSPDIMNAVRRGNYMVDDVASIPDDSSEPKNGKNIVFAWDGMENITNALGGVGMVYRRPHFSFWNYEGDEMNVFGMFDITIKLPPLPAGEWEVRFGHCAFETCPAVRVWLNGTVSIDSLLLKHYYYDENDTWLTCQIRSDIINYMAETMLVPVYNDEGIIVGIDDKLTGEVLTLDSPITKERPSWWEEYNRILETADASRPSGALSGKDSSGEMVNWSERVEEYREQAVKSYIATQPKMLRGPKEYGIFSNTLTPFSEVDPRLVRVVLGRLQSDGKSENTLRMKALDNGRQGNNWETVLDYLEFCPAAISDNED